MQNPSRTTRRTQASASAGLLFSVVLTAYSLHAQIPAGAVPPKKMRTVLATGDTFTSKPTPQGTIRTLLGTVIIKSEDTILTTDKAIYNEDTGVANSPGKLRLNDEYNTLTASTGTAFYKTRDAQFRGNVIIVARPRPDDKNATAGSARKQFDAPATILTEKVDYNWRTRICRILVPLTLKQKDRTIVADRGTYDARTEVATLEGNVKYTKPNGDVATAPRARAVLKEGHEEFTASGSVQAVFTVEDEDDATPTAPTPTNARPGGRPTGRPTPATPPANSPAPPTSTPSSGTEGNNSDPGAAGTPGQPPPTNNPNGGGTTP